MKKKIIWSLILLVSLLGIWKLYPLLLPVKTDLPQVSFYLITDQDSVLTTIDYAYTSSGRLIDLADYRCNQEIDPPYKLIELPNTASMQRVRMNFHIVSDAAIKFQKAIVEDGKQRKTVTIGDYHIEAKKIKRFTYAQEEGEDMAHLVEGDPTAVDISFMPKTTGELTTMKAVNPNLELSYEKIEGDDRVYRIRCKIIKQGYAYYTTNIVYTMKNGNVEQEYYGQARFTINDKGEILDVNYIGGNVVAGR